MNALNLCEDDNSIPRAGGLKNEVIWRWKVDEGGDIDGLCVRKQHETLSIRVLAAKAKRTNVCQIWKRRLECRYGERVKVCTRLCNCYLKQYWLGSMRPMEPVEIPHPHDPLTWRSENEHSVRGMVEISMHIKCGIAQRHSISSPSLKSFARVPDVSNIIWISIFCFLSFQAHRISFLKLPLHTYWSW